MAAPNGSRFTGDIFNLDVGYSIALIGDINGDGIDEWVIGSPDEGGNFVEGSAFVVFGQSAGFPLDLTTDDLGGTTGFQIKGLSTADNLGRSVGGVDINRDGLTDLIIGAPFADEPFDNAGSVYVIYGDPGLGASAGFSAQFDLASLDGDNGFTIRGADGADRIGWRVENAGDVNADGIDDLLIGSPMANGSRGLAYLVYGNGSSAGFAANFDLATADPSGFIQLNSFSANSRVGNSLAGVGDLNGDGIDDFIIGAPLTDIGGATDNGAAYVVYGVSGGFSAGFNLGSLSGSDGVILYGGAGDRTGFGVSAIGDINGDGFVDLSIGGSSATSDFAGTAFIVYGQSGGFAGNIDLSTLDGSNGFRIDGTEDFNDVGLSSAGTGDINGDGLDDFIVSAAGNGAYLIFGTSSGFAGTASFDLNALDGSNGYHIIDTGWESSSFSFRVDSGGDLNADGINDLVLSDIIDPGRSTVVYGGADNLAAIASNSATDGILDLAFLCFAGGTRIATPQGPRPVEAICPGDLVLTVDWGAQPVRWVGVQQASAADLMAWPRKRPIVIRAGALGGGRPSRDLVVSPQHRVLVAGDDWAHDTGAPEVLVPAIKLLDRPGITRDHRCRPVTYHHLLLDRHEILLAEDAPAESLYLGPQSLTGLSRAQEAEIASLCPDLWAHPAPPVRPFAQHRAGGKPAAGGDEAGRAGPHPARRHKDLAPRWRGAAF